DSRLGGSRRTWVTGTFASISRDTRPHSTWLANAAWFVAGLGAPVMVAVTLVWHPHLHLGPPGRSRRGRCHGRCVPGLLDLPARDADVTPSPKRTNGRGLCRVASLD